MVVSQGSASLSSLHSRGEIVTPTSLTVAGILKVRDTLLSLLLGVKEDFLEDALLKL